MKNSESINTVHGAEIQYIIAIFEKKVVVKFESTVVQNIELELRICKMPVIFCRKANNDVMTMVWLYKNREPMCVLLNQPPLHPRGQLPPQLHRLPLFRKGSVSTDWHHRALHPVEAEPRTFLAGCNRAIGRCLRESSPRLPANTLHTCCGRSLTTPCWSEFTQLNVDPVVRCGTLFLLCPCSKEAYNFVFLAAFTDACLNHTLPRV